MTTDGSAIRLGDLLTGAGLLKPEDLREAMVIAKNQALPVGRVLIMSNYISEHNLQAAVQAQSLLKDGLIDLDTVLTALRGVTADGVTLEQSLSNMGWSQKNALPTNKLGELLVEAGLLTTEQLDSALKQCVSSGLPLGRVLVVTGLINEALLTASLNAQVLLRDQKVTREQALLGLKASRDRQITIEQSLTESGMMQLPTHETVRLGELLVSAGLLDESQLMHVVELGLINEQPVGQILIKLGLTNENTLASALSIQAMVANGTLKKSDSGQALANANSRGVAPEEAAREFQPNVLQPVDPIPLYQFLQLAGIIGPKDIEDALKVGSRDSELMGKMLMLSGKLEQPLLTAALSCNDLITQGYLKSEQGIIAIGVCHKNNCTLDSAFLELGWNLSSGPVTGPTQAPVSAGQTAYDDESSAAAVASTVVSSAPDVSAPAVSIANDPAAEMSPAPSAFSTAISEIPASEFPQNVPTSTGGAVSDWSSAPVSPASSSAPTATDWSSPTASVPSAGTDWSSPSAAVPGAPNPTAPAVPSSSSSTAPSATDWPSPPASAAPTAAAASDWSSPSASAINPQTPSQSPLQAVFAQTMHPMSQQPSAPQPFPSAQPESAAGFSFDSVTQSQSEVQPQMTGSQPAYTAAESQPQPVYSQEAAQATPPPHPAYSQEAAQATPPPQPVYSQEAAQATPPPQPAYSQEPGQVTPPPQPAYNYESQQATPPQPAYAAPSYHSSYSSPTMEVNEPDLGVETSPTVSALPQFAHEPISIAEASSRTMDVPIIQQELTGESAEPPPPEKPRKRLADLVPNTRPPSQGGGSNTNPGVNI